MNQEIKSLVKKTARIAGVTCVAAGAAAVVTSAAAITALAEGARYLKENYRRIVSGEPEEEKIVEEAPEAPAEEAAE